MTSIKHHVHKIYSRLSAYLFRTISGIDFRSNIAALVPGSPILVGVSHGLPLRIDPQFPQYPLAVERCAADMADGELS